MLSNISVKLFASVIMVEEKLHKTCLQTTNVFNVNFTTLYVIHTTCNKLYLSIFFDLYFPHYKLPNKATTNDERLCAPSLLLRKLYSTVISIIVNSIEAVCHIIKYTHTHTYLSVLLIFSPLLVTFLHKYSFNKQSLN